MKSGVSDESDSFDRAGVGNNYTENETSRDVADHKMCTEEK